ncbi:subtilisin-like protein [Hyaloscypha variabilis F]|uniref:Subtilisin-like protein n=1 Tax=Hyaloscypha variabilis (strain UAMH 11265 / GT02V1 / F) TaxID=1149755 RepID=A0A2J6RFW8_HYAVF|nr:subtilisin-like protein [Hyaloscypha variabilis F]
MAPMPYVAEGSQTIALLLDTSLTIREIANFLKADEPDREQRHFYIHLMSHCLMIRDHTNRIKTSVKQKNELIVHILLRFESVVTNHVLEELSTCQVSSYSRLRALNLHWNKIQNENDKIKLEFARKCLNFGQSPDQHDELVECLEKWENDVIAQYPEDRSQWSKDDFVPQKESWSEPSYAVWGAAQSLFKALIDSKKCTCSPEHEISARLCLGTYRKSDPNKDDLDDDFDFDMFLSMKQAWQEVHVHTTKERVVQFALDDEVKHLQRRKQQSPRIPQMRVTSLCEPMEKIQKMASLRLEFKVEKGRLFKLRSERAKFPIDRTKSTVSLEQFIKEGSRFITEKTKRILAVLLSYAVLHLHGTPWLQPTWGSSSIMFFQTASSAIPLRPFIHTRLAQEGTDAITLELDHIEQHEEVSCDPNDFDADGFDLDGIDPDDLMLHHFPSLVTLAVMLMELYLATPFEILAKKYGIELLDGVENRTGFIDVDLVFQECKSEIPENSQFYYAIEKCLDPQTWEDEQGKKLDDQTLRATLYEEVIRPLETELNQAFSYISIDELDKKAQTLDFGNWGQTMQNQQTKDHFSCSDQEDAQGSRNELPTPQHSRYFSRYQVLPEARAWSELSAGAPRTAQRSEQRIFGEFDYKASKFFDDETVSEDHSPEACSNYSLWKRNFQAVYKKYIEAHLEQSSQSPVKIAVLDTGIDQTHPDMDARSEQIKGKYNCINEKFESVVNDYNGHGTFTAGLLLDYAPDAELYIIKIAENKPSNPEIIAKAINYAVTLKVDIISMSFGFPTCDIDGYDKVEAAIMNAYSKHVLLFAAASNSGANLDRAYPARDQNVICIHSTDANGNRSKFSPTAISNEINLATIGEAVESAWPVHLCDEATNPTFVKYKSGTSYATPIAAGIGAFLLQYARIHMPEKANMLKRQSKMKAVFRRIAEKSQGSKSRDEYHYVALSVVAGNLFGKGEDFINSTIGDLLKYN